MKIKSTKKNFIGILLLALIGVHASIAWGEDAIPKSDSVTKEAAPEANDQHERKSKFIEDYQDTFAQYLTRGQVDLAVQRRDINALRSWLLQIDKEKFPKTAKYLEDALNKVLGY